MPSRSSLSLVVILSSLGAAQPLTAAMHVAPSRSAPRGVARAQVATDQQSPDDGAKQALDALITEYERWVDFQYPEQAITRRRPTAADRITDASIRGFGIRAEHLKVGREELLEAEAASYHGAGTCTFYGTANSNQLLMEMMGLHMPGSSFCNPGTKLRQELTRAATHRLIEIGWVKDGAPHGDYIPFCTSVEDNAGWGARVGGHRRGRQRNGRGRERMGGGGRRG